MSCNADLRPTVGYVVKRSYLFVAALAISRYGEKVSFFVAALANDSKAKVGAATYIHTLPVLILPLYAHKEALGLMSFF